MLSTRKVSDIHVSADAAGLNLRPKKACPKAFPSRLRTLRDHEHANKLVFRRQQKTHPRCCPIRNISAGDIFRFNTLQKVGSSPPDGLLPDLPSV